VITAPEAFALLMLVQNGGTGAPLGALAHQPVSLNMQYSRQGPLRQDTVASSGPEEFMVKRSGGAADEHNRKQSRVRKVPGGWKLPGDPTIYPYNPLVPPDMVDPVPPPPGRKPAGGKTGTGR
jgi:hypothetical protein